MRAVLLLALVACKSDPPTEARHDDIPRRIPPPGEHHVPVVHPPLAADEGTIAIAAPAATVGQPAVAHVTVTPAAGYHINDRYPYKLSLDAPDGVELVKARLARGDGTISEAALQLDVAFTARHSGDLTIGGKLDVGVCRETACLTRTTPISIRVAAK
jgi:hypothetical protein